MSDGLRAFVCLDYVQVSTLDVAWKVWKETKIRGNGSTVKEGMG